MRQLTLKELQSFSLEILKDVAGFCERNGIRYSLGYGTLLGAVRHKGFIPWDDDVDLMMPREDYERFRSAYRSDKFTFIDSRNTPDCFIVFGRVCDMEKTIAKSRIPWINKDVGVWIDIFPVDRVPDDPQTYERIYESLLILMKTNVRIRRVHASPSSAFSFVERLRLMALKMINPRLAKSDPNAIVKDMTVLISLLSPQQSLHWSQLCCPDVGTNEFFMDEDINEYIPLRFEDRDFFAWKGYDRILRDSYGDYMILPPENKRKPLQSYIKFMWKD
jgi:lipopolysaccharide cholinephosphotransferase